MRNPRAVQEDPLGQLAVVLHRTLRILYLGFWLAPLAYLALMLWVRPPRVLGETPVAPPNWPQWQGLLAVVGIAALYLSYRLRGALLDPERLARRAAPPPQPGAGVALDPTRPAAPAALSRALQRLIGRLVLGQVLLWGIVEIPAILGVADRLISGESGIFLFLVGLTAFGLVLHRPAQDRIRQALEGIGRAPDKLPFSRPPGLC